MALMESTLRQSSQEESGGQGRSDERGGRGSEAGTSDVRGEGPVEARREDGGGATPPPEGPGAGGHLCGRGEEAGCSSDSERSPWARGGISSSESAVGEEGPEEAGGETVEGEAAWSESPSGGGRPRGGEGGGAVIVRVGEAPRAERGHIVLRATRGRESGAALRRRGDDVARRQPTLPSPRDRGKTRRVLAAERRGRRDAGLRRCVRS